MAKPIEMEPPRSNNSGANGIRISSPSRTPPSHAAARKASLTEKSDLPRFPSALRSPDAGHRDEIPDISVGDRPDLGHFLDLLNGLEGPDILPV